MISVCHFRMSLRMAHAFIGLGLKSNALTKAPVRVLSLRSPLCSRNASSYLASNFNSNISKLQGRMNISVLESGRISLKHERNYSTKTAPPPPPPPPPPPSNKNAKGQLILLRITRAFTFSFSTLLVIGALGISALVLYLVFSELFLPSGDTRAFNKVVKLVEDNEKVQSALGMKKGERLKAYGEVPADKWVRNRPIQSIRTKGQDGKDHHVMKFHVESDIGQHGTVTSEQIDNSFWSSEYAYIALDVVGHKRIYILEPKFQPKDYVPKFNGNSGFLGLKWGPKKDD
ncbi:uncharacterized protein PRCAT00000058001 [Priceomyces carsonii]|uniref:uncharacterized protein n=1 Tax=Priceomyces carsonii TaxID=28549 RepID=UPI002ED9825B|nr:unnamed protein product [Priceomyces carsonii]